MSQNVRGFKWLVGGVVGMSLLGACGAPMEGEDTSSVLSEQALGDVAVSLSVANSSLSAREDVAVTVTFTNVSSQPVQLLRWFVPGTEGVKGGLFEVSRNGEEVAYIGPHIKRRAPQAEDFVTLAPGESRSGTASLSGLYDLSESGTYSVRFAAQATHQHNVGLTRAANLDSNSVSLWVEGRANREPEMQAQAVTAQGVTAASNCSSTRASQISTAFASAKTYASGTSTYLNGISSGTARYTTWFGTYSSTNVGTARTHFTKIASAFASAAVTVDCSCTDSGTYAYVYPASPYKIYVCGAFWNAPNTGTDSRAGTLVHEMSHFTVVAGTDDHAYGQSAAKSLAKSSPTQALDNADNHEYIAENNPAQN
ncbi:peptidase M35 [Cystobacter fuscus]|uniref:M35 family metallo-endopeptidase n=1 Tax=Cystobacter fuscus TaxID=43 RepID=UPI002B2BBBC7|nr:peptidase M35 [Cystobacter fuscus]